MIDYESMAYNELRKVCGDRNLNAAGTKDELIARLKEADGTAAPSQDGAADTTAKPDADPRQTIERKQKTKALYTKEVLDKQPKVMVFIPFESGENPAMAAKIKQMVNINGYQFDVPRGVATLVPQQVAEMIAERLESEGKAGRQHRADASEDRQTALSE